VTPYALGDEDGEADFHVARETVFSSILPLSEHGRTAFAGMSDTVARERVAVRRLDGVFQEVTADVQPRRVFLKTDTEGYDVRVFKGAEGCLDRVWGCQMELALKPVFEGMGTVGEGIEMLTHAGFDVTGFFPVTPEPSMALTSVDVVARRRGASNGKDRH
jgi:FkbM family methyltransferase